jgi:hypothetical protein
MKLVLKIIPLYLEGERGAGIHWDLLICPLPRVMRGGQSSAGITNIPSPLTGEGKGEGEIQN